MSALACTSLKLRPVPSMRLVFVVIVNRSGSGGLRNRHHPSKIPDRVSPGHSLGATADPSTQSQRSQRPKRPKCSSTSTSVPTENDLSKASSKLSQRVSVIRLAEPERSLPRFR